MAKKKKAAPKPITSAFDPAAFRRGEEESMAALPTSTAPSSVVDEQTRMAATEPVRTLTPTGAQRAAGTIAQRNQAFQEELAAREASKPTEDPGPGFAWSYSVAEGRWKKVRTTFGGTGGGGGGTGGGDGGGGGGGGGGPTGPTGETVTYTAPDGRIFTNLAEYNAYLDKLKSDQKRQFGESAFQIFRSFLAQFGLEALAADVEKYKLEGLSDDELLLRLRTESAAYKRRFAANEKRTAAGLMALSEAEYIGLEDQYQNVMRRYGLPESYYARGEMGRQEGFEKFIAGDVSPGELEERIQTAQTRIQNAPTQIKDALSEFYGAEITNGDVLAYVLDPNKALPQIKRKITAAEIGGAAAMAGLGATRARAEELETFGVTGAAAREGFQTVASVLPRATTLSQIYQKQGVGPYTQTTAEQEVFGLPSAVEAATRRRKLTELEQAAFSGQAGTTGGALARERAGSF